MIPGIVASQSAVITIDFDFYAGASVVMDFENGVYLVDGSAVSIDTLIDRTNTIDAGGLMLDWYSDEAPISFLSAFVSALDVSAGYSVLADIVQYDVSSAGSPYGRSLLHFWNGTYDIPGRTEFEIQSGSAQVYTFDMRRITPENTNREVTVSTSAGEGERRKIAITRGTDRLSASVNGSAVVSDVAAATAAPTYTSHYIGGYPGDIYLDIYCLVKKLIFYPPIADVDLPVYSGSGSFEAALIVAAAAGSYDITGAAASFLLSGGSLVITADAGSYTVSGVAAAIARARRAVADSDTYAITGADAAFAMGKRLIADAGAYAVTGDAVGFTATRRVTGGTGSHAVTGSNAATIRKDPSFISVVLLAQFTGANGATTFTDQSNAGRTLTTAGNAQIQSNRLELDGATDYVTAPDSADWQLSGDFTIEIFGLQTDNAAALQCLVSHYDAFTPATNNRGWAIMYRGNASPATLDWLTSTSGSSATSNTVSQTLTAGVDYDLCVERSGTTVRFYVNGSMIGSLTQSASTFNSSSPLAIGTDNSRASTTSNLSELDGRMKAIRITKGAARYATDISYTVPNLPLPTA